MSFAVDNCSLTRLDHIHDGGVGSRGRSCWRIVAVNLPPIAKGSR
jgi:hypothetical protein